MIHIFLIVLTVSKFTICSGSQDVSYKRPPNKWGNWGPIQFCPQGTFAQAAQLKVQKQQYSGDDTGLNGIRLFCGDPRDKSTKTITSTVGPFGDWLPLEMICTNELHGYTLKTEPPQEDYDDASATNIRFRCIKGSSTRPIWTNVYEVLEQSNLKWAWGTWDGWTSCWKSQAICGIQTRVEENQFSGDDTGLNDVRIYCCFIWR